MPEGPEIRRQADRIQRAVGGKQTTQVQFGQDHLAAFGSQLSGKLVCAVESRGKALLTHFEGGTTVYSHNQLYGRWYITKAGSLPRTKRQLRFSIETEEKWALLYSASEIEVLDTAEVDQHPFIMKLGPDVLDPSVGEDAVLERLESPRFRSRNFSGLLLDQTFVAGLGNYLRSEILFLCGLLPQQRPKDLNERQKSDLSASIIEVTRRAYRTGGITVEDELHAELKSQGLSKRYRRHYVFSRSGQSCRTCGTTVQKHDAGGRRLYLCPTCQSP